MTLQPIKMQSTTQRVVSILRNAIFTRQLLPGEKIVQSDLAKQLNVSITPVREALMILESEQLVKIQPRKETIVLGVNKKYMEDYWHTRAVLEGYLVSLVCDPNVDISDIEEAHEELKEVIRLKNYSAYSAANRVFHRAIWNTAGNDYIMNLLKQITVSQSASRTSNLEEYVMQSFSEHEKIMECIRAHDAKGGKKAMEEHMLRALNDLLSYFDE